MTNQTEPTRIKPVEAVGLLALCLLWASAWLVSGAWPSQLPTPFSQTLHYLVATIIACAVAGRSVVGINRRPWQRLAVAGVGLLGVPVMLVDVTSGAVSNPMSVALFALVPIVIMVLAPYAGFAGEAAPTTPLLPAALVALTGTLLVLPFALPDSYRQAGFETLILVAVLIAAASSLRLHRLLADFTLRQALVVICAANALFFVAAAVVASVLGQLQLGGAAVTRDQLISEAAIAVLYDLPQLVLLVWLMRVIEPARFATRYFLVPLLTVVEGDALLRPEFTVRSGVGMVLIVLGVTRILTANDPGEEPRLILR